jgi:ribosomal protein S28E/S33
MFMPDFIRNLDEWIIWLLGEEFHGPATPVMIVQRTGYREEDVTNSIGALERMKAIKVIRNVQHPLKIEKIGLVPDGNRLYEDLKRRRDA